MCIDREHLGLWSEVFPALLKLTAELKHEDNTPIRCMIIGAQDISAAPAVRAIYPHDRLVQAFRGGGWDAIELDYHDQRAELQHDLNLPIARDYPSIVGWLDVVFDIGCLEHVADSHQCLENYLTLLKPGGILFLLTPVKGFYDHGLHTFSPEYISSTMTENGMDLKKVWWLDRKGPTLEKPEDADDVCIVGLWKNGDGTEGSGFTPPLKNIQQKVWVK